MAFNIAPYQSQAPTPFEFLKYLQGQKQQEKAQVAQQERARVQNALLEQKLAGDPQGQALKNALLKARIGLLQQQAGAFGRKGAVMGMDAFGRPIMMPGTGQPQGPQTPAAPGTAGAAQSPAMVPPSGPTGAPGGPQQQGTFIKQGFSKQSRGTGGAAYNNPWTHETYSALTQGNLGKLQMQHEAYRVVAPMVKDLIDLGSQGYGAEPTLLQPDLRAKYQSKLKQIVDRMVKAQALPNTRVGLKTVEDIYGRGPFEHKEAYRKRATGLYQELLAQLSHNESSLRRGAIDVSQRKAPAQAPTIQLDRGKSGQPGQILNAQRIQSMSHLSEEDLNKIAGGG